MKWKYVLAGCIFLVGVGGQVFYDFYYTPYIAAHEVVKVKVANDYLPKNYKLTKNDLYLDKVPIGHIPANAITDLWEAENKITTVDLTDGSILTTSFLDIDDLQLTEGYGYFPLPKKDIYAVNGSLRIRDKVDIYLVTPGSKDLEADEVPPPSARSLEQVTVVHVRSDDNNDIQDTETGSVTNRSTSTANVSSLEVKLSDEEGQWLLSKIEEGFDLWIVRVD